MRHVIWQPAVDEKLPDTCIAYLWGPLDVNGQIILAQAISVVAAIVPDDFVVVGTLHYDCQSGSPPVEGEPTKTVPFKIVVPYGGPLKHTFAGWPVEGS